MKSIVSEEYQTIIEILISARKSRGERQIDVAEKLDKPQSYVSKIEARERRIDILEFVALCRVLEVNPVTAMDKAGLLRAEERPA